MIKSATQDFLNFWFAVQESTETKNIDQFFQLTLLLALVALALSVVVFVALAAWDVTIFNLIIMGHVLSSFWLIRNLESGFGFHFFNIGAGLLFTAMGLIFGAEILATTVLISLLAATMFSTNIKQYHYHYVTGTIICQFLLIAKFHYYKVAITTPFYEEISLFFTMFSLSFCAFLLSRIRLSLDKRQDKLIESGNSFKRVSAMVNATLEATSSGIVFISEDGSVGNCNQVFRSYWDIEKVNFNRSDFLTHVLDHTKDAGFFMVEAKRLKAEPTSTSTGELYLNNGLVLKYISKPHRVNGEITGRVWSFDDVTHQQKTLKALEKRDQVFRSFFEHSALGVIVTSEHEKKEYINDRFLEMVQYSIEEIQDISFTRITHPDYLAEQQQLSGALTRGEIDHFQIEKQYIRKDKSLLSARTTVSVLRNEKGDIIQDVTIIEDLSIEKEAEKAIAQSEKKFRTIFESSPFPMILFKDNKILDCNPFTVAYLKMKNKAALLQQDFRNLMPILQPDSNLSGEVLTGMIQKARQIGCHSFEWVIADSEGEHKVILFTITPYTLDGTEAFLAIWNDLTEQKQSEIQINQLLSKLQTHNQRLESEIERRMKSQKQINQELKRSNMELEQFAYIASHDLQEPLRMVGNFVQLLNRKYSDQLDDSGRQFIRYSVDGVNRMSSLISHLLEYSKVGRKDTIFAKADLNLIVSNKMLDLYQRIMEKRACIDMELLPNQIECEPNQLGIVFYNLVGNAIKFNESQEPLVTISSLERNNDWLFAVADNGIGIEKEYAEKVFQIFQRLHRRDTYEGTGIGLSLCKRIVNRHKGKIWFTSEKGKGTTFYFTICKELNNLCNDDKTN